jgi:His/Glu/Gln/Arg/opine family amino acid ABC transporter permease subunit
MEVSVNDLWLMSRAAGVSLWLALASIAGGTLLAIGVTAIGFLPFAPARWFYRSYVFIIRGLPVLVLALLVFYGLAAMWRQTSPYAAGVVVLTIYLSALFAEVFRGGVLAIPRPLWDSAKSLALTRFSVFRRLVLPLAARYSLPPYLNVCVMAVKASSVLSIISVWELTFASREIIERTLEVFAILSIAGAYYFVMCFAIDRAGLYAERRLMMHGLAAERA